MPDQGTFTVSALAERLDGVTLGGEFPEERERLLRRLRYWTLTGVLRPAEGLHTGVGRHRRYDQKSILVAAVLYELAQMGLSLGTMKHAADCLYEEFVGPRADPEYWRSQDTSTYLRLSFHEASGSYKEPFVSVVGWITPHEFADGSARIGVSSVVIDLKRLCGCLSSTNQ